MTVTVPTTWEQKSLSEATPGGFIATGKREDLRDLNRRILRNFAYDSATNLATLSVPEGIDQVVLSTSFASISHGKARVWGNGTRFRCHVYGSQCAARFSVGGILVATATQSAVGDAWASSGIAVLAGGVFDADGLAIILCEVRLTATTGLRQFKFAILEEMNTLTANLPAAGNAETAFRAMHDALYATPDTSVDAFALQAMDDNVRQTMFERGRKSLHLWPKFGTPYRLSSAHWRLDGPYCIQAMPWSDRITVSIAVERDGTIAENIDVFCLSEFENFDEVVDARKVTVSAAGIQYLTFNGITCKADQRCAIWIAFRSVIKSASAATLNIGYWNSQKPETIYSPTQATVEGFQPMPWGVCLVGSSENIVADTDPTVKSALGYDAPSQILDLVAVCGHDPGAVSMAPTRLISMISPHPGTGVTTAPNLTAVVRRWNGGVQEEAYLPAFSVRRMGILYLYGVYVEAGIVFPTRRKGAQPGSPPSAGTVQSVADQTNRMSILNTPAAIIRHGGNRYMRGVATLGGGQTINYEGGHLFVEGADGTGALAAWQFPVCDPNLGAGGGWQTDQLMGQFLLMVCGGAFGSANEEEAAVDFYFNGGAPERGIFRIRHRPSYGGRQSPTEADALAAATATATLIGASPTAATANAYVANWTWPEEGMFRQLAWELSPVFKLDGFVGAGFPQLITANAEPYGTVRYKMTIGVIIAGLYVWWDKRIEF